MPSLSPKSGDLHFPSNSYWGPGMQFNVVSNVSMLASGQDPKPIVLDLCKPECVYWKEKLERCETALKTVIKINPGKTCMYPMRDYVTCVEACAQPKIHNQLKGTGREHY